MDERFREHGVPLAIRRDNGSPFASIGAGGLTRVSARWAKMGIRLDRIEPGEPQQNGWHERRHRTLKAEASAVGRPAPSPSSSSASMPFGKSSIRSARTGPWDSAAAREGADHRDRRPPGAGCKTVMAQPEGW